MKDFGENKDGVHLMLYEHSICGDAFDIGSEPGQENIRPTSKRVVTCVHCIAVLTYCRGVKTKNLTRACSQPEPRSSQNSSGAGG